MNNPCGEGLQAYLGKFDWENYDHLGVAHKSVLDFLACSIWYNDIFWDICEAHKMISFSKQKNHSNCGRY
jgi:hypothetical protein